MGGIDLRDHGISITESRETVSLSRDELAVCRHSQDVVQALEAKLGRSLKRYYYFKYNALDDGWECSSGPAGHNLQPKEVIKEVPVVEYVDREVVKEIIKEIPVEKVIYVDKPIPYEKVVEVEVVKYIDKPAYVDKIVDRIVESERKVYVDRVVETPVEIEKIVEVPVEPTMKALLGKWANTAKGWWS